MLAVYKYYLNLPEEER